MDNLSIFKGSRILITGHTGFKGLWLVTNLPYHLGRIWASDPVTLIFFLPACFVRVSEIAAKAPYKLYLRIARRVLS